MGDITDIILTSRNRLGYLERTLKHLFERTRSPYRLHVIDDQSGREETDFLLDLWRCGRIETLTLRGERAGIMANKNLSTWLSFSDPFVITGDDLLCPDLEPDWLGQGLAAMRKHPELMELDLDHPGAYRVNLARRAEVTFCEVVGGTFGFLRREFFDSWHLPHYRRNFGVTDDVLRCNAIRAAGHQVGYLNNVYCYHIGEWSAATEGPYGNGPFIEPVDWKTLAPPEEWRCPTSLD